MRTHLLNGDVMRIPLADKSVHCIVTSPPYWNLRSYSTGDNKALELGSEPLHDCGGWVTGSDCGVCFVCHVRQYAREFWRVLRDDGVMFLNLGDSYAGSGGAHTHDHANPGISKSASRDGVPKYRKDKGRGQDKKSNGLKQKDLCGIPWRVALALQADGWYLRSAPPWIKENPMPDSAADRPGAAHEYWFLLTKKARYYSNMDAVRVNFADKRMGNPGKYKRTAQSCKGANRDRQDTGFLNNGGGWEKGKISGGRNLRTNDFPRASLAAKIRNMKAYICHLEAIRDNGGMLFDEGGNPEAMFFNTRGYSGSHFATFNPDMIEPIIKFSTSGRGCCPVCGNQWERMVEKSQLQGPGYENYELPKTQLSKNSPNVKGRSDGWWPNHFKENKTIGFRPTCNHEAPPVPAIVLDPFSGSGTTVMVANQLGRRGIGMDLSLEYIDLAKERTGITALDAWQNGIDASAPVDLGPLFADAD